MASASLDNGVAVPRMVVLVYGAGAVGCFWGGLLARAGHDVRFVARGEQLRALQTSGIRIRSQSLGNVAVGPVKAGETAAVMGQVDLVLVCVKDHQTPAILDDLAALDDPRTVFVGLQNGIEADARLAGRLGGTRVLSGVVYVGASIEAPGVVDHVARGLLLLGNPHGVPEDRAAAVAECLGASGLQARLVDDIDLARWRKLMWNSAFNAVSALTLQTSVTLLGVPETRAAIRDLMREVAAVARAEGVPLTDADVEASLDETARLPPITTSMVVDRSRGRRMETEALVGVVVRLGRAAGVPTPVSDVLYSLLKAVDAST